MTYHLETIYSNSWHVENTLNTDINAIISYYFIYCHDLLEVAARLEWIDKIQSTYDHCLEEGCF